MKFQPRIMIDSGAYSAYTREETIDLDAYIAYVHALVKRLPEVVYINLDVIDNPKASYDNWRVMCKAGLKPIPVFHLSSPTKWLAAYIDKTDYIALGGPKKILGQHGMRRVDHLWEQFMIGADRKPTVKVHGLGYTTFTHMKRWPWYSLDSTSALQCAIWGGIWVPRKTAGVWDYGRAPFKVSVSSQSPAVKQRNAHILSVPPTVRLLAQEYLRDLDMPMGTSTFEGDKETVLEAGVTNSYKKRVQINAVFFARFASSLPAWPWVFRRECAVGALL